MPGALPGLVLVPGMLCDARLFAPQIAALEGRATISVADVMQDATIGDMAQRLLDSAPDRFVLAGLSLGGIVAMEVLRIAPSRVTAVALLATNHKPAGAAFIATRTEQIARARAGGLRDIVVHEMKAHYLGPQHAADEAMRHLVVDMAIEAGPAVFERQALALMSRRDQTDTLASCRLPALLMAGANDELCPPVNHRTMQALMPQASLRIIDGAGHLLSLEAADSVTTALSELLGL